MCSLGAHVSTKYHRHYSICCAPFNKYVDKKRSSSLSSYQSRTKELSNARIILNYFLTLFTRASSDINVWYWWEQT